MSSRVPAGLTTLLDVGQLPEPALTAAAGHADLLVHLCDRDQLPARTLMQVFAPGRLPAADVAARFVDRRLPQAAVAHIVGPAGERRRDVLRTLVSHNVPAATPRRQLLHDAADDPHMIDAILGNPRWPLAEQFELLHGASGATVLAWLARLDPDIEVTWAQVLGKQPARSPLPWRLDGRPVLALHALLRRPWLAEVPLELAGFGLRAAIATLSADERTLYRLLGTAQRLAVHGQRDRAAQIIEAVACNPSAPLGVQRRARRLARRIPCTYLDGWLPTAGVDGPVWEADPAGQHRAMDRIEQLSRVRHRTVWSAALLARNPALVPAVADRIVRYLDRHLRAVDEDGSLAAMVGPWLGVDRATLRRWTQRRRRSGPTANSRLSVPGVGRPEGTPQRPAALHLVDCRDEDLARVAARELTRRLGQDPASWEVAWLLLSDGWDLPLRNLPAIVHQLHSDRDHRAA